jgi:putative two-component system response regulator
VALADRIGLPEDLRIALRRGGIVHDVGKVVVPEHILLKPGPLTDEEWVIMRQHPIVGEKICSPLKSFRLVVPIIRYHHEKLNGSGYPDGLIGDEIPITARVLQIVDVYDALTTDRPYRKALSPGETLVQMRTEVKRGWWDSALVDELEVVVSELEAPMAGGGKKNSR